MVRSTLCVVAVALAFLALAPAPAGASGRYVDDDRSRYEGYIEAASAAGLVSGCNPPTNDRFCPHRAVTRAEVAILLSRAVEVPKDSGDHFADDDGLAAEPAIDSLAAAGVTSGCGDGKFCPSEPLSRGQFAELVVRTMGWKPSDDLSVFRDLSDTPHGPALVTLARQGGLEACDPPENRRICPEAPVTRDEAVYALAKATGLAPAKVSSATSGPELGFHDPFDELKLWDGKSPSSRNRVRLTDSGFKGSGLAVKIPRGSHYGADFKLDLDEIAGDDPETLFFRYYVRFEPGWNPRDSGKLPGFSGIYGYSGKGGYRSSPSAPGWSARMKFTGVRETDGRARLGYYVYHLGQERRYGDGMHWNEAGKLQPGEWYCVEGELQLNRPGLADGALRGWVDGTLAFEESGIAFRRPDEPEIRIESFWFNVYYGGKPRAPTDLGITFDEVVVDGKRIGCGAGNGVGRKLHADIDGDGFSEWVRWSACDTGPCFTRTRITPDGLTAAEAMGNGAWFSLDTHRLGIVAADLDGDGDDDLLYRGRCGRSLPCWRAHRSLSSGFGRGQNWGDGAWFSSATQHLVAGDWNGDGLDDLAYVGLCGRDPTIACWRVHLSRGDHFADPTGWGTPPDGFDVAPQSGDLDGDGRDDLFYAAPCESGSCWFGQFSTGTGFSEPLLLGETGPLPDQTVLFDYSGDGRDDLLIRRADDSASLLELRPSDGQKLGPARPLARVAGVTDLVARRAHPSQPVEVLAVTKTDSGSQVIELLDLSGRLVTRDRYDRAMTVRLIQALSKPDPPMSQTYQ